MNNIGTGLFSEILAFFTFKLIKVNYYLYMFSHIYRWLTDFFGDAFTTSVQPRREHLVVITV